MNPFGSVRKWAVERKMPGAFLAIALVLFGWYNMSKPRILVLHSYDKNYAWVRDINAGLARGLTNKYLYQLNWYNMDTKRHPDPEFKRSAGIAARDVIEQMKPDVLIAIDDDAQQLAAKYFVDDPRVKIVFAGVNNQAKDYGYDRAQNVTGILERLALNAIRETLSGVRTFQGLSHPIRIAFLGDDSGTVTGDANQVRAFDWAPHELSTIVQVTDYEQWQAQVRAQEGRADIILITNYRGLHRSAQDGHLVPPEEVVEWTERNSPVPVLCGNAFYTEDGGMLAIGTSPYEQGEVAARYALAIALRKKAPKELPVITSSQFVVTMRESRMKARHFELPAIYEAAARTGDKYFP